MEVRFEGVTKKYGGILAVNDLSLKVEDGDFLVLLGPSGCGKTTLLRCLAGLESIDEGCIYIGEERVDHLPPHRRDVAMVFQNYALYPHLTVLENIAFPLEARKMPKPERERRALEVANLLGIAAHAAKKPKQLSGGEAQRVALGRAIIRSPKVFLMDEPFSNLDAKLRAQMRVELQKLHRAIRTTTIFVTHDQEEAMTLGRSIAIIKDGVLQQVGTPWEVYNRPANVFVARFIGSPEMNLLEGELLFDRDRLWVGLGRSRVELPVEWRDFAKTGPKDRTILVGIRPEDVSIVMDGSNESEVAVTAEIDVVELVGREQRVYMKFQDRNMVAITSPEAQLREGMTVRLRLNPRRIHLFDPGTTMRISA